MTTENILSVRDLRVTFDTHDGPVQAVRGINLDVKAGETIAIVGESGSGKSQTTMAMMGLLAPGAARRRGQALYRGQDLIGLSEKELNKHTRREITMIFQGADDLARILYTGLAINWPSRFAIVPASARRMPPRILELLKLVGIPANRNGASTATLMSFPVGRANAS